MSMNKFIKTINDGEKTRYFKTWKESGTREEITRDQAIITISKSYNNPVDVLAQARGGEEINCMFSVIKVIK